MAEPYDKFRRQCDANSSQDCRVSDMIENAVNKTIIYHVRYDLDITVSLGYSHKEGVDKAFTISYEEDDVLVGDYLIYDRTGLDITYLVYNFLLVPFYHGEARKHEIVECNIDLKWDYNTQKGAFYGSLRSYNETEDNKIDKTLLLTHEDEPLVITAPHDDFEIGLRFIINEEPYQIVAIDKTSNKGIYYMSLARATVLDSDDNDITISIPDATVTREPGDVISGNEETVTTNFGYFESSIDLEVTSRSDTEVKYIVPSDDVTYTIYTKDAIGDIVENTYRAVI